MTSSSSSSSSSLAVLPLLVISFNVRLAGGHVNPSVPGINDIAEKVNAFSELESVQALLDALAYPGSQLYRASGAKKRLDDINTEDNNNHNVYQRTQGSLGSTGLTADIESRILNVKHEIRRSIGSAVSSVEADISSSNRNKVLLALVNFLGMAFGVLKIFAGTSNSNSLSEGEQILVTSQLLYGYGYWGPFALEYEDAVLKCGLRNLEKVEADYAFIDYDRQIDPVILKYFITEQANRLKKALYCITSRKGSNSEAKKIESLINLQAQLQKEKIDGRGWHVQ